MREADLLDGAPTRGMQVLKDPPSPGLLVKQLKTQQSFDKIFIWFRLTHPTDTQYAATTGKVTHMEPDVHLGEGFLIYSESKLLKTSNGSASWTVAGTTNPAANQQDFG